MSRSTKAPRESSSRLLRAKAQGWAKTELVNRHLEEYQALYDYYCQELGLDTRARNVRPEAPSRVGKRRAR